MKTITRILLLTIIGLSISCEKTDDPNQQQSLVISQYIQNNYLHDARQIYMDKIAYNNSHPNHNDPILDTNAIHQNLAIIQAVYNLNIPEHDTVFDMYNIHGFYCYYFKKIHLKVDTSYAHIQNLAAGKTNTGHQVLDNILTTCHFDSVKTTHAYPHYPAMTIYSDKLYNMLPITESLSQIPGITWAYCGGACGGDGNTITIDKQNNKAFITFSIGRGDCMSGCIYHRYWQFVVENNIAKFVKSWD